MKIIDAHMHLYDSRVNKHPVLDQEDPDFAELAVDFSALPPAYLLKDYLEDCKGYQVDGVVWHEFVSTDPVKEVEWAKKSGIVQAMVAAVDFLSPDLEKRLAFYSAIPAIASVREHVLKDKDAISSDFLRNEEWLKNLEALTRYRFKCALVVYANQLSDLYHVYRRFSNIQFTLPLMGWPDDLSKTGFEKWKKDIRQLAQCPNFKVGISALECIFGMDWTIDQVRPWVLEAIETFGFERCMFGSHLPIAKLSRSFKDVYDAYTEITAKFSPSEKEDLFYRNASEWFSVYP